MNPVIIIADDNIIDRTFVKSAMEDIGIQASFVECINGLEIIRWLRENENKSVPSVVVLDINMPQYSGHQVLDFIKCHATYRAVPVVAYSHDNSAKYSEKAIALGATAYQVKPTEYNGYLDFAKYIRTFCKD